MPRTFQVFRHPTLGCEAVKRGFSWPAFVLGCFWAFAQRLWGVALAFLGLLMGLATLQGVYEVEGRHAAAWLMIALQIGLFVLFGVRGNAWRAASLCRRGYALAGAVEVRTADEAVAKLSAAGPQSQSLHP